MKSNQTDSRKLLRFEIMFLIFTGVFLFACAAIQPLNYSPDEEMRYKVVDYIFRHNRLPLGGDPEVLDPNWGISYAFYPMLSYMFSVVFMKIVSIFTMNATALLIASRFSQVLLGVGSAFFIMKIGERFFKNGFEKMFLCMAVFLPGAFQLFTYINCDALALFSTSMLIWCWIKGLEEEWSIRTCIFTGIGVSLCALSYYNAYGVVVATIVVFVMSILFCEQKKWNFKKLIARGLLITLVVLVLAGWWFVRNYVNYDGDFLGLSITTEYAEKYAAEEMKPSSRFTFQENPHANLLTMIFYQPVNHHHNWILMVFYSFVGCFGYMEWWPPEWIAKVLMLILMVGMIGVLAHFGELFSLTKGYLHEVKEVLGKKVRIRYLYPQDRWNKESIFRIGMVLTLIIPNLLNMYNSYVNDYQPQGRYSMPMLVPLMYFAVEGHQWLMNRYVKKAGVKKIYASVFACAMILFMVFCFIKYFVMIILNAV